MPRGAVQTSGQRGGMAGDTGGRKLRGAQWGAALLISYLSHH